MDQYPIQKSMSMEVHMMTRDILTKNIVVLFRLAHILGDYKA